MTIQPWVAQALATRAGPFTPSHSVHASLAARALARVAAHNRLRNPNTAVLPAGGIAFHPHQHDHLMPPHGTFATNTARLLVFSDKTALVADQRALVPFVWRVGGKAPGVDGLPDGTVLACTFGDRGAKPALILANAERPKDRSWAIAIPHAQMRFSDGYAAYASDVSRVLMDHVDALATLAQDAPAIADKPSIAVDGAWLAPFQSLGASPTQERRLEAMAAFAAILHVLGANRGALASARILVDGRLDWSQTWAGETILGQGTTVSRHMTSRLSSCLTQLLPICGVDPMDLLWQSDRGMAQGLETSTLFETDAQRPSAHLELALRRALAG
jgi:hypothetical protein